MRPFGGALRVCVSGASAHTSRSALLSSSAALLTSRSALVTSRARLGCSFVLASCACVACASSAPPPGAAEAPPVFGGEGASLEHRREIPLGDSDEEPTGPCGRAAPPGDVALLDDFEDEDARLFKAYQREGWWFVAVDDTAGTVMPEKGKFHTERLPAEEASTENQVAAHFAASGFGEWGAVWGTSLSWVADGIRCPLNASAFAGVRFRAKGSGTIQVRIGMPDTIAKEHGGRCELRCYDFHTKLVRLTPEWSEHVVRFDRLQQGGWGTEVRFDPASLSALHFAADSKQLPVDFWVDDIAFVPREDTATPAPPPAPGGAKP